MCPKITPTKSKIVSGAPLSRFEQFKSKLAELHRVTIFAIILYLIFVVIFLCANILTCAWHFTMLGSRQSRTSKRRSPVPKVTERDKSDEKKVDHVPLSMQDDEESESETSFGDDHNGLLDRLGMKIDQTLTKIFTG